MNAGAPLTHSLLFVCLFVYSMWDPPTIGWHLISSLKPLWKHVHRHSQRCISQVIVDSVKLTMKVHEHKCLGFLSTACWATCENRLNLNKHIGGNVSIQLTLPVLASLSHQPVWSSFWPVSKLRSSGVMSEIFIWLGQQVWSAYWHQEVPVPLQNSCLGSVLLSLRLV